MTAKIEASEKNLAKVFCEDYIFKIPVYQRPYAWEREQVEELFDDLDAAMDAGETEPYFLGSIVLVKEDGSTVSDVVDGQQRLTTLTILLCVLRELSDDDDWKSGIDIRVRQKKDVVMGQEEVVRLRLKERDQNYFKDYVQSEDGISRLLTEAPIARTDSQQRIRENVEFLYEQVKELSTERRKKLSTFILQDCYLVVVRTDNEGSAYRVFSVMNDRGLDLAATDILKAAITGDIQGDALRTDHARKWEEIEEGLGRDRFADLFTHIRMIYAKSKPRKNLQDEFKEHVLPKTNPQRFVDEVLAPHADAYEKTLRLANGVPNEVRIYLAHLSELDNVDWIPPAMAVFLRQGTKEENLLKFMRDLERLAYAMFIRRANVNERIQRFGAVLKAVQDGTAEKVWTALELGAEEKEQILERLNGAVYRMKRVRKPLLLRLDKLMAGAEAEYAHAIISIEHVLPQKPRAQSEWLTWFPDEEERESWTDRLANLVLLSRRKNSRASNFEFGVKKEKYFFSGGVSPFALTTAVMDVEVWTPQILRKRQDHLLGLLMKEWRLH